MKFYKSAKGQPEDIQITNDAFHFITKREPCLDEDNAEEIEELRTRYKYGFAIVGEPVFVEDSDLVEITIIPNILSEVEEQYTHYFELFDGWQVEYFYVDNNTKVKIRFFNTKTGESMREQVCDVEINKANKPQFVTDTKCIFPLWSNGKTHIIKRFQ